MGLVVIGNPPHSEGDAWRVVERRAAALMEMVDRSYGGVNNNDLRALAHELRVLARSMRQQVDRGVHVNPRRNPPRDAVMSENVQAVVYTHRDDGEFYIHAFGNREPNKRDLALLSRMGCFADRTRVRMIAEPDGSVLIGGMDGQNLWKEF